MFLPSSLFFRRSYSLLLSSCFLLLSCGPSHDERIAEIDQLRAQAEALITIQSEMGWDNWVFGKPSNQDSLYRASGGLFTPGNIALLRKAEEDEQDAIQRKRLHYFRRYLTTEYIAKRIAPLTDSVSNLEATLTVIIEGNAVPYRQVNGMIAAESDQGSRAAMYRALDPALDSLNTPLMRVETMYQALSAELGYASYNTMIGDLKGIDLGEFRNTCEEVLERTEQTYLNLLQVQLAAFPGLSLQNFHRYDTGPLFRSARFTPFFPADSMLPSARKTLSGMGIDLDAMKNLHIDAEVRERKNPRAVCFPVRVPTDVRLSIKPNGGADDFMALFHELGHGLHFASTTEHAVEFKYMGEPTATETHAFLLEYLVANQTWLRQTTSMPALQLKEFVGLQAFRRLYYIRRYSAKFLYEFHLHTGMPAPEQAYAELLSKATAYNAIPSDSKRFMTDLDALYYSAGYLRAWFLEAQLSGTMANRFGANWYESPEAGEFLRILWAQGDRLNGDELAASLGYDHVSPEPLIALIDAMVLFSTP